ncbi:MAG: hypothetical protein ACRDZ7_08215 [Acidimicrobiia bacterium]
MSPTEILVFVAGALVVVAVFLSAVSTVVVPRGVPIRLTRVVFLATRKLFEARARFARTYEDRDRAYALYAPLTLVALPVVWLTLVLVGYTAVFWALGSHPLREAFITSGSSLLTLGFASVHDLPSTICAFTEAVFGLILLALLITYLPSMYSAFSRREVQVALVAAFAGTPPWAIEMLERFHRINGLDRLDDQVWVPWTTWFVEVEETHTSLSALPFFRSPQPDRSWVTAAGVVLDGAALYSSALDVPRSPPAELCIRTGYISLRTIADLFGIPHDPDPEPDGPISIARDEFDAACDRMAANGLPVKPDRDQAWRDFAGWRVNYDTVLVTLAGMTRAPFAPWSSDRSASRPYRPPVRRRRH